ncbi:MAG: hypothetical protein QXL94_06580 [Candidatus Parvarchaeum sp.]
MNNQPPINELKVVKSVLKNIDAKDSSKSDSAKTPENKESEINTELWKAIVRADALKKAGKSRKFLKR